MIVLFKKFIAIALVGAFFTTTFTPFANANQIAEGYDGKVSQELTREEEVEAQRMAEDLEFIFEEASVKDEDGNLIGFQEDMLVEKFGETEEITELMEIAEVLAPEQDSNNGIQLFSRHDDVNKCVNKKVAKEYKSLVSGAVWDEIWGAILAGAYLEGAKKLVKAGVKGSAVTIGVTLMKIAYNCADDPY